MAMAGAFSPTVLQDYAADLIRACGGDSAAAPRPAELDNTRHVGTCSMHAAPALLGTLCVFCVLRRLLCREKLRTTYSGSEDAPELEQIVSTDGRAARRVDAYSSRAGRLVTNGRAQRGSAPPRPKAKKGSARERQELEPVFWPR